MIRQHLELIRKTYEERFLVGFDVEFSIQDPSTDTITVDVNNKPVRDEFNEIVFRPGGHGSLLKNLNSIDSDLIIIKNISTKWRWGECLFSFRTRYSHS